MTDKPEEFQLDKKQLTEGLKFPMKGMAESLIEWVNSRDFNHDGKKDIGQIALLVMASVPVLAALNDAIDFEELAKLAASCPAVKDHAAFSEALKQLGALAERSSAFLPKE